MNISENDYCSHMRRIVDYGKSRIAPVILDWRNTLYAIPPCGLLFLRLSE
jgi:hypothetical protein